MQDYESEYTVVSLPQDYPAGAEVDFQVEALIGYEHGGITYPPWQAWVITGDTSGWSNTQTITISPTGSTSPTTTPNQESQQTGLAEMVLAVALIMIVVGAGIGLLVYLIRRK